MSSLRSSISAFMWMCGGIVAIADVVARAFCCRRSRRVAERRRERVRPLCHSEGGVVGRDGTCSEESALRFVTPPVLLLLVLQLFWVNSDYTYAQSAVPPGVPSAAVSLSAAVSPKAPVSSGAVSSGTASPTTAADSTPANTLFVEVRSAALRREPKLWSPAVETLSFGDQVQVLGDSVQGAPGWMQVKTGSAHEGFMHVTALTSRVVVIRGSELQDLVNGNEQEVVLAGKGFSDQVENLYRENAGVSGKEQVDFDAVDRIEQIRVAPERVAAFVHEGGYRS